MSLNCTIFLCSYEVNLVDYKDSRFSFIALINLMTLKIVIKSIIEKFFDEEQQLKERY